MRMVSSLARVAVAVLAGGMVLLSSGELPLVSQRPLISSAYAIIGRPLTPMSYAGVARRTTRRAYGYGYAAPPVIVAPVIVVPVVPVPVCRQFVDAYGRLYPRC
jgi:hypothetical protein